MKRIVSLVIFILILTASFSFAEDWESYEVIGRLLEIQTPVAPVIYDNLVIFTAASDLRKVGVAFAHEGFSNIYWFRQLLIPQDWKNPVTLPGEKFPSPYKDSGIQFFVYQLPDYLRELEYRIVVNGLWTTDPSNPQTRRDPASGLAMSILNLPPRPANYHPLNGLPEGLSFSFKGPPGETVTVAGNFNGWDPFMYELREAPAGHYSLTIPLPPGTYQYVFFHRGQRYVDPYNPRRIYSRDGSAASEVVIP
jgi:hypothetical protein